jgi:hypothetical protein
MIEAARRHGHSDPRYAAQFFGRLSASARARRALLPDTVAAVALDDWESEGGASAPRLRAGAVLARRR